MATLVQSNFIWKLGSEFFNFQYVSKEFGKLHDLFSKCRHFFFLVGRFSMEVIPEVQNTTSGRRNDVIKPGEVINESMIASFSFVFKSGICHRLAAAGLVFWIAN